jgi:hypothetical protein
LCTYELNNGVPYGSPNLNIGGNYWGSSNTAFVDGKIYDYFDFANQSVVYYMPILTQAVPVDTSCQPFQVPMGVRDENQSAMNLQVFPNPTNGEFTISVNESSLDGVIEILNPLSQVVYREVISGTTSKSFTLPEECGVYILRLTTEDGTAIRRIVKQ